MFGFNHNYNFNVPLCFFFICNQRFLMSLEQIVNSLGIKLILFTLDLLSAYCINLAVDIRQQMVKFNLLLLFLMNTLTFYLRSKLKVQNC